MTTRSHVTLDGRTTEVVDIFSKRTSITLALADGRSIVMELDQGDNRALASCARTIADFLRGIEETRGR